MAIEQIHDIIDMDGVGVRRQGRWLLEGIRLRTRRGEHWALLGANGAGKTTLLQLCLGQLWATQGRISILGHTLGQYDVRELRKTIGFVSVQMDIRLDQEERAANLVISGLAATHALWGESSEQDRARALELLDDLGASAIADQSYGTLSQGERGKVLLARALMPDPQLLVLDEPCSGLDFPSREHVLSALSRIAGAASPQILYVTHYPGEILPEITHVAVLKKGRLIAAGAKEDILCDAVLSDAYELPVRVSWLNSTPVVRAQR
ncbi:MAG: ABC transporter ATP-binding protein [Bacilli bacterium]